MGASIAVPGYPANNLVPGVYFGIDASQANTAEVPQRALLIGQQAIGRGLPSVPMLAGSVSAVRASVGAGTVLARMYEAFRAIDPISEVWLLPMSDDSSSVQATGSITIAGTATASGVLPIYIGGQLVALPVATGNTGLSLAGLLGTLIGQMPNLPVVQPSAATGSGASGTTSLQAKNGGLLGNDIDIRVAYLGAAGGEATPPGLTVTTAPMATGAQNPGTLAAALAMCADAPFDFIACPYTDTASLNAIQAFLASRWTATSEIFGHAFAAFRGTPAQRATFAQGRNDRHTSILGFYDSPTPCWEWTAQLAALAACSVSSGGNGLAPDPALPIKGGLSVLAPPFASRDGFDVRQTMLRSGLGTFVVDQAGQVSVDRIPTSYTTDPLTGLPDNSFRDTETDYTLMACLRDLRIQLSSQFQRKKLVDDGNPIAGGSNTVSPSTILGAVKARYKTQADVFGWAQNAAQFNRQARAVNAGNGVVTLFLPYQLANQLIAIAGNVQFTKP